MTVMLFLILFVIGILLALSGCIVLLIPHKNRSKKNIPQTLSQALGIDKIEVSTLTEPIFPKPADTEPLSSTQIQTSLQPLIIQETDSQTITNTAKQSSAQISNISIEQIKQLVVNNEMLIALANGVQKMNNARKDEQVIKTAKDLLRTAENFESTENMLAVKPYIEIIYPNFFKKLDAAVRAATITIAEDLTDFEVHVCLLQIFDLSSKEIAQITNRSIRTVETTVYKIRKKLLIPTEIRLPDFLKNL